MISIRKKATWLMLLVLVFTSSCTDNVDESDLYTWTGDVVTSYMEKHPEEFSKIDSIFKRVRLSKRSSSTLSELLSTRGNYTCFLPTNDAVQEYLDSVYLTKNFSLTQLTDSAAELIAKNCIIDNEDDEAFKTTDFQIGSLSKTNLNDRSITISFDNAEDGSFQIVVNSKSVITQKDIKVENGMINVLDKVMSPYTNTLPSMISETDNLRVFGSLLKATGWDDKMQKYVDADYEDWVLDNPTGLDESGHLCYAPKHRYTGFTAFVETDSVFFEKWGIDLPRLENDVVVNSDEIMNQIIAKCKEAYPDATDDNMKSENNAVNRFVSYHLLPARIAYDKLVIHYSEMGYNMTTPEVLSIDCHEYYETMGYGRRLIKLTDGEGTKGKRINRHCTYNRKDYSYTEADVDREGILITENNGGRDYNALNGYYYAIDDVLVYDEGVPNHVLNERLRFDISSLLPELMTNNIRRNTDYATHIPNGYCDNITVNGDKTNYSYLSGYKTGWPDYQGDEHNITGQYDFTFKLPPVPYEGTYEIRWSIPTFTTRGMAQFYLGKDKSNLPAIGLPVDLRLNPSNPTIGWVKDTGDEETDNENDKVMRTHGYMKPPMHDGQTTGSKVNVSMRDYPNSEYLRLRRIVWTGTIKPTDVLYLRVKSVLKSETTQFVMDWLEIVPKTTYNGAVLEDNW